MPDVAAQAQLDLIKQVHGILEATGVEHWLGGGWGVDFRLGRITREHRDVDFAVWAADWPKIEAALVAAGYTPKPPEFPDEVRWVLGGPADLEFWMMTHDAQGRPVVGGRWAGWPFIEGTFEAPPATLEGIVCPVLSADGLIDSKVSWASNSGGEPMREHDISDVAALRLDLNRRQS